MIAKPLSPDFLIQYGEMPKEFISGITQSKPNRKQNFIPLLIAIGTFTIFALWMYHVKQDAKLFSNDKTQ